MQPSPKSARLRISDLEALERLYEVGNRCVRVGTDFEECLATLLQLSGHFVQTAYGGQRALELATAFQPDVLLLDIGMTDLDGYQLAEEIRAAKWGTQPVLVAVSGWGREEDRQRAFAAGFDHHLTKPITGAALEAVLQSVSRVRPGNA